MGFLVSDTSRRLVSVSVGLALAAFLSTAVAQQGSPPPSPIEELSQQISDLEASLNARIDALEDQLDDRVDDVEARLTTMADAPKLNSSFCFNANVFAGAGGEGFLEGGASWDSGPLGRAALKGNLNLGGQLNGAMVWCIDVPIVALDDDGQINAKLLHQQLLSVPEDLRRQTLLDQTKTIEDDIGSIALFMKNTGLNMTGQMESVMFGEMQDFFVGGALQIADVLTDPSDLITDMEALIFRGGGLAAINTRFGFVPFKIDQMAFSTRSFLENDPCTMTFFNEVVGVVPGFDDLACANSAESLVVAFKRLLDTVGTIETQVGNLGGAVSGSGQDVIAAVEDLGLQVASVGDQVTTARNQLTNTVNSGFSGVNNTLGTLQGTFNGFQNSLNLLNIYADGLFTEIISEDAFGRLEGLVESNLQLINSFTSSQLSALQSAIETQFNIIKPILNTIEGIVRDIEDFFDI